MSQLFLSVERIVHNDLAHDGLAHDKGCTFRDRQQTSHAYMSSSLTSGIQEHARRVEFKEVITGDS